MTFTVPEVTQQIQTLLTDVAEQAVDESDFCQRKSPLGQALFVQSIVLTAMAEPHPTLNDYAQTAAAEGTPVSPQAFDQRFTPEAVDCLQRTLDQLIQNSVLNHPPAAEVLQRFDGVYLQDATFLTLPEEAADYYPGPDRPGERAMLKLQVQLDLKSGRLDGPLPEPGKTSDARTDMDNGDLPKGSLHIADRGYFKLDRFQQLSDQGVYWLTEYQRPTAIYIDETPLDLLAYLSGPMADKESIDIDVFLGARHQLGCRLLAWRVKPEVANRRRQRLKRKAADEGREPSAEQLALCDWTICLTTIPRDKASVQEVAVLLRARWQIEILFRVRKSGGGLDSSRSDKGDRMTCEVLGKLIAQVLSHWLTVVAGWSLDGLSLYKAYKAIRQSVGNWIVILDQPERMQESIRTICRRIAKAAKTQKRTSKPSTSQQLMDPWCVELAEL